MRLFNFFLLGLSVLLAGFSSFVSAAPSVQVVYRGLDSPWGMAEIAPGKLLISEKEGNFVLIDVQSGDARDIAGAPKVVANGQGGLLDVAVPRDYKTGGWIYCWGSW